MPFVFGSQPLAFTRMPSPTVSVVTSVYNDAARVRQAVESLLAQTFADWELIIVDDGSTDHTSEVTDSLASSDSRIHVLHQQNTGLTLALLRGCGEARGQYIARQDADDFSHPERLTKQLESLQENAEIAFVSCWSRCIGPDNELLEVVRRTEDPTKATTQLLDERMGPPAHGSVMFRKSTYDLVGGYRPQFYFGQDSDLWLRMAERGLIAYVPEELYAFRRDGSGISGIYRDWQREFGRLGQACRAARREGRAETHYLEQAERLSRRIREARRNGELPAADGREIDYLIGSQLAVRGDGRARRYLWRVIRKCPWHWRAWARLLQASCPIKKSDGLEDG